MLQQYQLCTRRRTILISIIIINLFCGCKSHSEKLKEKILIGEEFQCFKCIYYNNEFDSFPDVGICFYKNMKCYEYRCYSGVKTPYVYGISHKKPSKKLEDNLVYWSLSNDSVLIIGSKKLEKKVNFVSKDTFVITRKSTTNPKEIYVRETEELPLKE